MTWSVLQGDCRDILPTLPAASAQCCVTSPPYWWLRDYGHEGQIGLEDKPEEYVEKLVAVFREVRRVLTDDGTLWLNLGDSYANDSKWGGYSGGIMARGLHGPTGVGRARRWTGLKAKDLIGIPWRVAFALQADGWWLRSDIIWHKPNPMPESVKDRPTKSHEYLFMLTKSERYYYDEDSVRETATDPGRENPGQHERRFNESACPPGSSPHTLARLDYRQRGRNRHSVWTIATEPFPGAHFAVMPPALVLPCVLAGSRKGDTVLDPFAGACTVGLVAHQNGRDFIGCELNPEYATMGRRRIEWPDSVGKPKPVDDRQRALFDVKD